MLKNADGTPGGPPPGGSLHTLATENFEFRVVVKKKKPWKSIQNQKPRIYVRAGLNVFSSFFVEFFVNVVAKMRIIIGVKKNIFFIKLS